MRKALLGIVVGLTFAGAASADEWVVEAHFADQAALQRAARHFDHVIVDRKRNVLRVETTNKGIEALEADGLAVTVDAGATARLQAANARVAAVRDRLAHEGKSTVINGTGYDSIPGYECFRTVEGTYATMDDLVSAHPDIAAIDEIGPSWKKTQDSTQGYEMRAMHITNFATLATDPDRPKFAVYFSIHAREYTPAEIGTRFSEWLVNNYGTDPEATWLVDHNDFHLILMANPDARKEAEQQIYHRKNMDDTYGGIAQCGDDEFSQFGIDLNRNFPFHWDITRGLGSDDDVCSQTYHGPYADGTNPSDHIQGPQEPETVNLFSYVAGTCDASGNCSGGLFGDHRNGPMDPSNPSDDGGDIAPRDTSGAFVDMHSNAALVLWPWGDTATDSPNVTDLTTFGRRIAYFNGYTPEQSNELYLTDGTTDDSMYGLLGVAAYTIETNGFDFFEDCASFESNTAPTNLQALRYMSRALHAPYELPAGPDTIDVEVSSDLVVTGDPVTITAHLDSSRFNQSNGTQPVNNIVSAGLYEDVLPWDTDAVVPMTAADGAFDSPVETAVASVIASSSGRHFVYVQAGDTAANSGTPNGAFYDVADASQIGTLSGTVTDHASGDPVGASIALHNPGNGESHTAISDPATGDYAAHAFPGSFDVTVSAPHYIAQTLSGVALAAGGTVTQNFSMLADCVFFDDDVENGSALWTAQPPWVIVNNVPGNPTHVWNTPNYQDGIDRSLTTASSYDLTGYSGATLDFDDRCDTESGYDFGYVEFSTNGSTWTTLYSCSGQSSWQSHHLVLPSSADNASAVKVRFRLNTDFGQNAPGWAVDNIRFAAGGDACIAQQTNDEIFADGFEP
ncbi:MAG TPA: M14 family zinc carboxypeptidase [Rhodanobacteraceae bacterium]|nr:M14 family zinc carboxypeptidase [Rhodanobacteraceae bacterium]